MKNIFKFYATIVCLLFLNLVSAQIVMPNASKHDFKQIEVVYAKTNDKFDCVEKLNELYPVYLINSKAYVAALAKKNNSFSKATLEGLGIMVGAEIADIVTLKIPINLLHSIQNMPGISYLEIAAKIKPMLDRARKDLKADSVQNGFGLSQAYAGKDVMIGVTDWGFDYTHPMFFDTLLQQTRIHAAWDQYRSVGNVPTNFNYGVEFTTPAQLLAAGTDTNNIYDINTHGSHVAGIAGGSGAGIAYRGMAPCANFLFTTFLVDNGSVLEAFAWMKQKAETAGKRLVINMSWGLYHIGSLDGNSLMNQAIDAFSDQGLVFVSAAGNNGNVNFHLKKTFSNDALLSEVQFYPYAGTPKMYGQSISAWGEVDRNFNIGFKVTTSNGTTITQSPMYSILTTTNYIDSFLLVNADTVFYNLSADYAHPANGRSFARLRIKNTHTNYKILLQSSAVDGAVHFWNVTELTNDVGNWGQSFVGSLPGTTAGDKLYGIGDPACSKSVISVAAYNSSYLVGATTVGGAIATFSSFGPTLDERVKPDISAPGGNVASSINHFTTGTYTAVANVTFNNVNYKFARLSGTSMASPAAAGVVALLLEANPTFTAAQIKNCLQSTAREDANTGIIPILGSTRWGAGKVNALEAVRCAVALSELELNKVDKISIYPNPTNDIVTITSSVYSGDLILTDCNGKILQQLPFVKATQVDLSAQSKGIYFIRVQGIVKKCVVL
jgi:minor extracellular serine protease Vpr